MCDFKSWPGGKGPGDAKAWAELKQVYNFTEEQALAYNDNPIDNLEGLASFRVPVLFNGDLGTGIDLEKTIKKTQQVFG